MFNESEACPSHSGIDLGCEDNPSTVENYHPCGKEKQSTYLA